MAKTKTATVTPLGDRVLVKRVEADEKTKGGIILPDNAKEKPREGVVIAVGNGKLLDNDQVLDAAWLSIKIGAMTATGAVILGTLAGLVLARFGPFRGRTLLSGMTTAPPRPARTQWRRGAATTAGSAATRSRCCSAGWCGRSCSRSGSRSPGRRCSDRCWCR